MGWIIWACAVLVVTNAITEWFLLHAEERINELEGLLFDEKVKGSERVEKIKRLERIEVLYNDMKYHHLLESRAKTLAERRGERLSQKHINEADESLKPYKRDGKAPDYLAWFDALAEQDRAKSLIQTTKSTRSHCV